MIQLLLTTGPLPNFIANIKAMLCKTQFQVLCRPLPLTWHFSCEDDADSSCEGRGKRGGGPCERHAAVTEEHPKAAAREKHWGEILEKSFSTQNLRGTLRGENGTPLWGSWNSSEGNLALDSNGGLVLGCPKHSEFATNNNVQKVRAPLANGVTFDRTSKSVVVFSSPSSSSCSKDGKRKHQQQQRRCPRFGDRQHISKKNKTDGEEEEEEEDVTSSL